LSEKNQTEDGTLDDPTKDVAKSIVFQFTETDVNILTMTNVDHEDFKDESLSNHQGKGNTSFYFHVHRVKPPQSV
jgi:hypothetical protein